MSHPSKEHAKDHVRKQLLKSKAVLDLGVRAVGGSLDFQKVVTLEMIGRTKAISSIAIEELESVESVIDRDSEEMLVALREVHLALEPKIESAEALVEEINKLLKFDFITQAFTGIKDVGKHNAKIKLCVSSLRKDKGRVEGLIAEFEKAIAIEDHGGSAGVEKTRALKHANDQALKILGPFEKMAIEAEDAGRTMQERIQKEAIYNYSRNHPDKAREDLKKAAKALKNIETVGSALVPKGWAWVAGIVILLTEVSTRVADEVLISKQGDRFDEEEGVGAEFIKHDENPLEMAEGLVSKHKANLKIIIAAVGVGGEEIPGWSAISAAIETVVESYFDKKLDLARKELASRKGTPVPPQTLSEEIFGSIKEELSSELEDVGTIMGIAKQLYTGVTEKDFFIEKGVKLALAALLPAIWKKFTPMPAQAVSGADLIGLVNGLAKQHIPEKYLTPIVPTQDPVGRKPEARAPSTDRKGRAIVDTNAGRTKVVDEEGGHFVFHVCIEYHGKKLWGYLDSVDKIFQPDSPDDSAFSHWSNRVVQSTGYQEGDTKVTGTWHKPIDKQDFYLFVSSSGDHEWAHSMAQTAGSMGKQYALMEILRVTHPEWVQAYVWDPH